VTLFVPVTQRDKTISRIVTEKVNTVSDILRKMRTDSDNALDYRQVQLIVIQNNLAQNEEEMGKLLRLSMEIEQLPSKALVAFTDDDIEKSLSNIDNVLGVKITSVQDFFIKGSGHRRFPVPAFGNCIGVCIPIRKT